MSALLLVPLGLIAAQVFWKAYGLWPLTTDNQTVPFIQPMAASKVPNVFDYATYIGSAHLFGQPLAIKKLDLVTTTELPESLLKVVIKGILALDDAQKSVAILSVQNAQDKVFKVGAEITPEYKIRQIVADGVVVDHLGRLEMIRLPRVSMADLTAKNGTVNANSTVGLRQLRDQLLSNPLALEQHIAFVPYTDNGAFTGYRVNPGSKPAMFEKLGLQANDIIKSIDGVGIGQLAGRMDILTNLSIANSLNLGIIRNNKEQQLLVDFSQ
ncbi:type II secretion system protein GspC [Oceanospirillaceae bacterium]|nr:type II secretion system protein GspC [Oceanospirillaceae bacterium]MDC1509545.1 type II secretion system protein GspC [Oceanospirillaceae bacterium]